MVFLIQTDLPGWQMASAMSHAIHKIVSKRRCQSYFISRRSPHHGISKDSDLCASAHRCPHYAYARLIARVTLNLVLKAMDGGRDASAAVDKSITGEGVHRHDGRVA